MKRKIRNDVTHPTRYYSDKQEKAVSAAVNGRQQPNSGATAYAKGDVVNDDWLIECKTKTKESDSFSIKKEWFEKNLKESLFIGKKHSAVAFNFGPGEKNYYIIDELLFQDLMDYERSLDERTELSEE